MRTAMIAAAATMLCAGAALAHDYVVVASTDPAIAKGVVLNGGAVVPLASGRTLTVMSATGALSSYRGGEAVVALPRLVAAAAELTTVAQIVAADAAGCKMTAKVALDAYVTGQQAQTQPTMAEK